MDTARRARSGWRKEAASKLPFLDFGPREGFPRASAVPFEAIRRHACSGQPNGGTIGPENARDYAKATARRRAPFAKGQQGSLTSVGALVTMFKSSFGVGFVALSAYYLKNVAFPGA